MQNSKIFRIKGNVEGPVIAIVAGVHGDEKCGVEAFDRLLPDFKVDAGEVIFIVANLKAAEQNVRFVDSDLNRAFVDEKIDTLEGKTAEELKPLLDEADAMLDIHASFSVKSAPFCACERIGMGVASVLPADKVITGLKYVQKGSTDEYMDSQGKVGICLECGWSGSPESTDIAVEAIKAFCSEWGLISGKVESNQQRLIETVSLYKNKNGAFKPAQEFEDFEKLETRTLVGKDGHEEVYADEGDLILFVQEQKEKDKECFVIAREIPKDI